MNWSQFWQWWRNNRRFGENSRERNRAFHLAPPTLVMPDPASVWGIDISHWNLPPVDLKRMRDLYGLKFVIIKGCDGSLNTKYYRDHIAAAKYAELPWGMYNWLYPNSKVSLTAQVNTWAREYLLDPPPLGMFIDCEWTYYGGVPANPGTSDLRGAHDLWKSKINSSAMTYTAAGYANPYLKGFDWSREELWVAHYGVIVPQLPLGASGYTFWQFTSSLDGKTLDPHGNGNLDGDTFHGTLTEFNARYGGVTPPPPPPPTGDIMLTIVKVVTTAQNIRNSPSSEGNRTDNIITLDGSPFFKNGDIILYDKFVTGPYAAAGSSGLWGRVVGVEKGGVWQTLPVSPTGELWAAAFYGSSAGAAYQVKLIEYSGYGGVDLSQLKVTLGGIPVQLNLTDGTQTRTLAATTPPVELT